MIELSYPDSAVFYSVTSSGYGNTKVVNSQEDVSVIFLQGTGYNRNNHQDAFTSDAVCFPDPTNDFIINNHNRLEGMYILAPLFDATDAEGWFKVVHVNVNRDHLLENQIDNIELQLKRTSPLAGVS